MPAPSADEIAERIIKTAGLTFSIAIISGSSGDIKEAREMLKAAIVEALEEKANGNLTDART